MTIKQFILLNRKELSNRKLLLALQERGYKKALAQQLIDQVNYDYPYRRKMK